MNDDHMGPGKIVEADEIIPDGKRSRDKSDAEHETSIARYVKSWHQDWGPLYKGIATELDISLTEAMTFYWVQQASAQNAMLRAFLEAMLSATEGQKELQERAQRYMDKADEALDEGEDWKE